ncbi:Ig-like domain-containing protein [Seonamhaeicola marinus]|uniref:Glycosyl hydrolase family 16 n=1 Tax=Seonamhaeicola marinus TaxID=1912246 RepID=A0A5D0IPT2_9FLAO|nr:Ig-like domain-containing protein [Seonamhaeicola marinus]TYA84327.1 glycosyl hydrolase family 16 [Seonamhaeicola marinus]
MKNITFTYRKMIILIGVIFTTVLSCERELSDEAVFATFPSTAEVFTDTPVGLGTNFYFPYGGSKPTAWTVDMEVSYEGNASMRFDVPNANDPDGNYAGAIFRIDGDGSGRDLSGFDALTFWAKATQAVTIGEVGFGEDFGENKFVTTRTNIDLTTNWVKYVVPIPDPSMLIRERGLLRYSAGGIGPVGNEVGYTFWMDEVKFEKLGTVAQPQPAMLDGQDVVQQSFNGSEIDLGASGLKQVFNVDGRNVTVYTTPAYFLFESSDPSVATVDEKGVVTVRSKGTAKITATIAGVLANGSLEVTSSGDLQAAPIPTRPAANVKSIFSDAYVNATESNFNPGFGGSTTQTTQANLNGDNVQIYTNNNFTGIIFNNTVDGSALTHLHVDVYTQQSDTSFEIQIRDVGGNGEIETNVFTGFPDGDDKDYRFNVSGLTQGAWNSIDIPLSGDLAAQKNNLGALILAGGPDFILDNIYFYSE